MSARELMVGAAAVAGLITGCAATPDVRALPGPSTSTPAAVGSVSDPVEPTPPPTSGPEVAPGSGGVASACRPANHRGVVTPDQASAGHRQYRVTLTAPSGYAPCQLAGAPTQVVFHGGGVPLGVEASPSVGRASPVRFGPGNPVHFDIQVPDSPGGAHAGSVTFTLRTPTGAIPGEQQATGSMEVDAGTRIGPVD